MAEAAPSLRTIQTRSHAAYPTLLSFEELRADPPAYDACICGSDQIWNPELPFSDAFFLNFGPSSMRRIAYAASFGLDCMPQDKLRELAERLQNFHAIGVRENSAVDLVKQAGHHPELVLDPTLLLDRNEWAKIAIIPNTKQ